MDLYMRKVEDSLVNDYGRDRELTRQIFAAIGLRKSLEIMPEMMDIPPAEMAGRIMEMVTKRVEQE